MCELAKRIGFCPLMVEGALENWKVWCNDFKQQALCGAAENKAISRQEINFKPHLLTTRSEPVVDGVRIAGVNRGTK